jgi:hypothetical protein
MQFWWVIPIELVACVLFGRSIRGWTRAGAHERLALDRKGRFTRQELRAGRRALSLSLHEGFTAGALVAARCRAEYIKAAGFAGQLWNLGALVALELMLSGFWAFGAWGRLALIPQVLIAAAAIGSTDWFGAEIRRAKNWLETDAKERGSTSSPNLGISGLPARAVTDIPAHAAGSPPTD